MATLKRKVSDVLTKVGIKVSRIKPRGKELFPGYVDEDFSKYFLRYCHQSMVPWQGMLDAYQAAKYIAENGVSGDVVECGVWRGGISALMKDVIHDYSNSTPVRNYWLFDTFEGMTEPTEYDFKGGRDASDTLEKHNSLLLDDGSSNWCRGDIKDVMRTMEMESVESAQCHFIKGPVEKTLNEKVPEKIAILRLDTDFYESTKIEMEVLFERLVKGGIFIVDDYGAWAGARKAVDDYFALKGIRGLALFNNHAYGALIGVKVH